MKLFNKITETEMEKENKMYKKIIIVLLVVLGINFIKAQGVDKQNIERPNILWVVSEDNTTMLRCYGDSNAVTPTLDKLASEGIQYNKAYSNAPVCAPARSTIITGMYASSLGTANMRSKNSIPKEVKFFPQLLRQAGYYCTNNPKEDYNTIYNSKEIWDESSNKATWENRKEGQPFFSVFNFNITHEHVLFKSDSVTTTNPQKISLPPYHPDTKTFRHDYAQYYDRITEMDSQINKLLNKLKQQGLYESTIIFYYGDNGGILPGTKRFINEPGTHIPMMVRIPEKYKFMFKEKRGTKTDRLVSFVDLAPTILSLCGINIPNYMQGEAFLGNQAKAPHKYVFMYHQRMDERYDFVRAVRDQKYRYIRNFMPFLPRGQHIEYLWRIPSMQQWFKLYKESKLNNNQKRFFEPRVCEELYDMENDPYELNNLADNCKYQTVLQRMRNALDSIMIETKDAGFIPEPELIETNKKLPPYTAIRKNTNYNVNKYLKVLSVVNQCKRKNIEKIKLYLQDKDYIIRFWATNGALALGKEATELKDELKNLLNDKSESVKIIAAETLFNLGEKEKSVPVLKNALNSKDEAVRLAAINSIERLGEDVKLFEKEIKNKLNDPYMNVKKVARWILHEKIKIK